MEEYTIGEKIRIRRKALLMNQEDVAARINVSRSQLSKWEMEKSYPSIENFVQLCNVLMIHPDDLIEGTDIKTPPSVKTNSYRNHKRAFICMIAALLILVTAAALVSAVNKVSDDSLTNYKSNVIYTETTEDGNLEYRKVIQSIGGLFWADVIFDKREGTVSDCTIKSIMSDEDLEIVEYYVEYRPQLNKAYVFLMYMDDGFEKIDQVEIS